MTSMILKWLKRCLREKGIFDEIGAGTYFVPASNNLSYQRHTEI